LGPWTFPLEVYQYKEYPKMADIKSPTGTQPTAPSPMGSASGTTGPVGAPTPGTGVTAEQAEKARLEKGAAVTGAQGVADAVKKVADAAVTAARQVSVPLPELRIAGVAGGKFQIRGSGFGASGTVTFGGVQVKTIGWSSTEISGLLPADVKSGEVVVHVDDKTSKRGQFKL
jgi:hypothetical protein